jgi:glutathione reductase (NADPH)
MKRYDLIVIGTGNAGTAMSLEARHSGWSVAIVDELQFGGTCAVKGCIPKKILFSAAEVIERVESMKTKGINGDIRVVWPDLIRFKRTLTDPVPSIKDFTFAEKGIETYHGHARFLDKNTIQVGNNILTGRFIGIATGAVPRKLGIPGEELVSLSDEFLAMNSLPDRIVFIGGGLISFEFANVAAWSGAKVTILQRSKRALKNFDSFLVDLLIQSLQTIGIEIMADAPVVSVKKELDHLLIRAGKNGEHVLEADMAVHGAGREPNIKGLDLESGDVSVDERGILINQHLQSISNPSVYVAGDANARGKPLSPIARLDGRMAARNMIQGNTLKTDYSTVPGVVFTSPLLASVGLGEEEAMKRSTGTIVHKQETSDWYSNRRVGIKYSGYKILTDEQSGKIIGAHLLGYNVDETINLFALAMRAGLKLNDLQDMAWAYPTGSYDVIRIR